MTIAPVSPWEIAARWFEPFQPSPYLHDPVGWIRNKLGEHLWSRQAEIAESVRDNRRTAVKSCHNAGKSWIASRIACWWLDVHPPGEAFIVSTAPTYAQVHAILWEEIRAAAKKAKARNDPLPGKVFLSDEWKLDDGTLVGWGRKPADQDEHSFQGVHRRYVLVLLDEACGIPAQLWTAVEAITTGKHCRILAIGNPDDPATEFGNVCKPGSGWMTIRISAFDSPNFTDEPFPEHLRDLMLDPDWVEDKKRRWGESSPRYISKVLGEFPDIGEDILFPPSLILAAQQRELAPGPHSIVAVDVARFGSDRTIISLAQWPKFRVVGDHGKQDTMQTTGKAIAALREHKAHEIRVDGVGVGGGVVDRLVEQGYNVVDMQAGAAPMDSEHFINARSEWFWSLKERMEAGDADIDPDDEDLAAQLGSLKYKYTSRGQVQVESKDDLRKRKLPSPDRADTMMLASAHVPTTDVVVEDEVFDDESDEYAISMY